MRVKYKCNKCGCSGTVEFAENARMTEIMELIEADHKIRSPGWQTELHYNSVTLELIPG